MTENNTETKIQTESQSMSESNKPWYKKKNTIIAASSILGVGVLATVIAVPIALTTNNTTTVDPAKETIDLLNGENNKTSRIDVWNGYAASLNTAPNPFKQGRAIDPNSPIANIVYTDVFVTEFINFLIDNLYVKETPIAGDGSVTAVNAKLFKDTLLLQKDKFMDNKTAVGSGLYTTYENLFSFGQPSDGAIFSFVDAANNPTINIKFFMPESGLDLIYNADKTVSLTIPPQSSTIVANNVRLEITNFPTTPAIATATNYYFKPDSTIKFPSTIMSSFPKFLETSIAGEIIERDKFKKNYADLKTSVDVTTTSGLSYWNSYALNFKASNITTLNAEIAKTTSEGGIYTFIKDAIPTITDVELGEIKKELAIDASNGLSITPFVSSPAYSDLLFNTLNSSGNKYSLALDITKFTYDVTVNNLFGGPDAIKITPKLTLSGTLTKDVGGNKTDLLIASKEFDFSNLINITNVAVPATGGLLGFVDTMINLPSNTLALETKGLVAFNDKSEVDKITAWNTFNGETATNQPLILTELKKPDVLYNFIHKNADLTNPFGVGSFPTPFNEKFKETFNTKAGGLASANLSFVDATNTTTGAIILQGVQWGAATTNLFTNITFYFGHEANTISDINLTSNNGANMSLSQTIGDTTFTTEAEVIAAAKKRLSIVFETGTTTHVVYLGQKKDVGSKQVASPIIIPNSILTATTKFTDFIIALK